eukprot:403360751
MSWVLLVVLIVISYIIVSLTVLSFFFPSVRNQIKSIFGFSQSQANANNGVGVEGQNQQEEQPHIFNNHRDQVQCPICIDDLGDDQVAAMCSHIYCAKCIMSYWRTKREHKIECPYCRRNISFLVMKNPARIEPRDKDDILRFNNLFSSDRTFSDRLRDFPFLIGRFRDEVIRTRGLFLFQNCQALFYILLMAIYFLSPFDLIPEFIFGIFGMIDDLIVVIYAFVAISSVFYQFMVERNREEVRAR